MFLFKSKNQKNVKKWVHDHEEIVTLSHKVIESYSTNNKEKVRETLRELNILTTSHFMNEDLEFYKLSKESKKMHGDIKDKIDTFKMSFAEIKKRIMNFLSKYSQEGSSINEEFYNEFTELMKIILKRFEFEEKNLYSLLNLR